MKFKLNEERWSLVEKCWSKRSYVLSKIAAHGEANPFPKFMRSLAEECTKIWNRDFDSIETYTC